MEKDFKKLLTEGAEPSEYINVHLNMGSRVYIYGRGWTENGRAEWTDDVVPAMKKAGFQVMPAIHANGCMVLRNLQNKTHLYMHPMQFAGDITRADLDKITSALSGCKTVYDINKPIIKVIYDWTDEVYRNKLIRLSKGIGRWASQTRINEGADLSASTLAFKFAERYRVPRFGEHGVITGDDIDVRTVRDIIDIGMILK